MPDAPGYPPSPPMPPAQPRQGACFRYLVPPGWQVTEDGQFAVVMVSPSFDAIVATVGNAGLPLYYAPGQYLFDTLGRMQLQGMRFGQGRPVAPLMGFPQAVLFDVDYMVNGVPCHGLARCSVAPSYDCATMVMSWVAAQAHLWAQYASWLPAIADQIQVTNSAAFGASGIAAQNLQNSIRLGEQARQDRAWSEQQWAEVTREREASEARNNFDFRQAMDGVQRYDNPYTNQPIDLPLSNAVYWINPLTGQILGDPNPGFDPRIGGDPNWQPMRPTQSPER